MFAARLKRAGEVTALVLWASLQACAQGIELTADQEDRGTAEVDGAGLDAGDYAEPEFDAAPEDDQDPFDAGEMRDARVASDAGSSRDSARPDASELSDGPSTADSSADATSGADIDAGPAPYSCPACMLKVQWNTSTTAVSTQTIAGYLKLTNTGTSAIALSGVTVRYWLREPMAESMVVECYHWDDGKGVNKCTRPSGATGNTYTNLTVRVGSGANDLRYIELGFPAAAGELVAGGSAPGAMQLAFHLPSYGALMQSDDPSFDATLSAAATSILFDAPKITGYLGGKLAWGTEP